MKHLQSLLLALVLVAVSVDGYYHYQSYQATQELANKHSSFLDILKEIAKHVQIDVNPIPSPRR